MFNVVNTSPGLNAVDVDINLAEITITFSEEIDPTTVTDLVMSVGIADSQPFESVSGRVEIKTSDTIRFIPDQPLDYQTKYVVVVTGGSFGIKSSTGRTLGLDYLFYFTTVEDPNAQQSTETPISGISLDQLTSTLEPTSWTAQDGQVTIQYPETLPDGVTVTVNSAHLLGYPVKEDYWRDNVQVSVSGSTIILTASGTLPLDLESRLVKKDEALLFEDSIPVISYNVSTTDITATFDFAVNYQYTIQINIPDEGQNTITFLSYMAPSFLTIAEAKYALKGLADVFTSDDELAAIIYLESKRAYQIWTGSGHIFPTDRVPYYVQQYVIVRLVKAAIDIRQHRDFATGNVDSITLGDLKVSLRDPGKAQQQKDFQVNLEELNQLEYIYGERLKAGDTREIPIYEPTYSLMAPHANYGIIALTPSVGRIDPTYNPDFKRDLDYVPPKKRIPGPEFD